MKKLKTNKQFTVPSGRGNVEVVIRMIVSHFSNIDINNVKVEGYYYYLSDENDLNSVVKIPNSDFGQSTLKLWDEITYLENMENSPLADLCSTRNLKDVLFQRVEELIMLQLKKEAGENWGTIETDWIEDND